MSVFLQVEELDFRLTELLQPHTLPRGGTTITGNLKWAIGNLAKTGSVLYFDPYFPIGLYVEFRHRFRGSPIPQVRDSSPRVSKRKRRNEV